MNFTKRNKYFALALLVILNIVFRLPVGIHEYGVDSFFIHNLATTISTYGYAGWTIHPVSFMGLYPLSYASAAPFFLSGMSQITGLSIESIILLFCILLGVFSVFFTFLFAKEVKDDDLFAFLVAFVFSLSPNFLRFTLWDATTRNLFMAFLPLFLWSLIRCGKSFSIKNIGIAIVSFIFLLVSHRVSLFLPFVLVAFVVAVILSLMYQRVKYSRVFSNSKVLTKLSFIIFPIAFLLLFSIQFSGMGFYNKLLPDFYTGHLFSGDETYIVILNVAIDYFGKMGVLLFFGLIGFITISRTAFNDFGRLFVVLCVLSLTPLLVIENYTPLFILPFFSILVGFGLIETYIILQRRKRIAFSILAICLILSTGFSVFMLDHWDLYTRGMPAKTYATASFLGSEKANGTSVANYGLLSMKIAAFSGKACLPYGGTYAQRQAPEQLIYGSVKPDDVVTRPLHFSEIFSMSRLYAPIKALPSAKSDWVGIMSNFPGANKTKILSSKYDAQYVIESIAFPGEYWYWRSYYSRLLMSLHYSGNKIYANGLENIWLLKSV